MSRWGDLETALAVQREGTVAAAATALGVAPSTVYRRLDALEAGLGVQCFVRGPSGVHLTAAGRRLVATAAQIEDLYGALHQQLSGADRRLAGEVVLTLPEGVAALLVPRLAPFVERYPEVQLTLTVDDATVPLAQAHVAIRVTRQPPPQLIGRRLTDVRFRPFATEALASQAAPPWVVFGAAHASSPQGRWEARSIERVAIALDSRVLFVEAVAAGLGVGVLPEALGMAHPALVPVGEVLEPLTLPLWVLTRAELRTLPRVRAVLDFVIDTIGAHESHPRED